MQYCFYILKKTKQNKTKTKTKTKIKTKTKTKQTNKPLVVMAFTFLEQTLFKNKTTLTEIKFSASRLQQ